MEEQYKTTLRNEEQYKDKVKLLQEKLDEKRESFSNEINTLILESGHFDTIPETQVKLLSLRHQLIDYYTGVVNKALVQANTFYEKGKKNVLLQTKTNYDVRLTSDKEKQIVIDADTRVLQEMIELIEAQVYYIKESVKLLDSLTFSIKNRIDIHKFEHGG